MKWVKKNNDLWPTKQLHDRLLFVDFTIGIRNFANHKLNSMQFIIVLQVPTFILPEFRSMYFTVHGLRSVQRTEQSTYWTIQDIFRFLIYDYVPMTGKPEVNDFSPHIQQI
jgi:hypothetical protein